jgi:hypothetical protein
MMSPITNKFVLKNKIEKSCLLNKEPPGEQ